MIKLVCFDLDGTLVDSEMVLLKSFDHAFMMYEPEKRQPLEWYRRFMGPTLVESFTQYARDEETMWKMFHDYLDYYKVIEKDYVKIFDGANTVLSYLKSKGIKLCLVTNKYMSSADFSLKYFGLYPLFDDFFTLEKQGDKPKPNRYAIDCEAEKYGIDNSEIIMVGDNNTDMMTGFNAECKTIMVDFNAWFEDSLKKLPRKPDHIISNLNEIINIINKENNY